VASDSRRRSIEFASLNAVGVPLRVLRRSLLLEQAVIVVVGVVLGVVAGLIAGELSLGLLPEFPPGRQGPVLPTSVGVGATNGLIAAGVLLVLLLAGAIVASLLTMRRVHPENVRSSS
jgi:predicted lysophospholipase L1 biosynthesis ABC-type transport system permease subunit